VSLYKLFSRYPLPIIFGIKLKTTKLANKQLGALLRMILLPSLAAIHCHLYCTVNILWPFLAKMLLALSLHNNGPQPVHSSWLLIQQPAWSEWWASMMNQEMRPQCSLWCSFWMWHRSTCPSVSPNTLVQEAPLHSMPHLKPAAIHFTCAKIMCRTTMIGVCKKSM
jgi:hypothetical protein